MTFQHKDAALRGDEVPSSVLLSRDSADYDDLRCRLIPCFDEFYCTALSLVQNWLKNSVIDVLGIGAGTGIFSAMTSARHPVGKFCLLDGSTGMLERARHRFLADRQIEFRVADMAEEDIGDGWDLVISALAIHHLSDGQKRDLYRRINDSLKPGGLFVNAEQVAGPNPAADARYARIWLEQIRQAGLPEEEINRAQQRMAYDQCASAETQIKWLREVGFTDVDCSFKAWRFAVLSGRS